MKSNYCIDKCKQRDDCTDADKCNRVGPELYRIEYGDHRIKKHKHRTKLRLEADMDRIEYMIFRNKEYGDFQGD